MTMNKDSSLEITKNPSEAAKVAFKRFLPQTQTHPRNGPYGPFNRVNHYWGAKRLYRGRPKAVRKLVLHNLRRISKETGFKHFQVDVRGTVVHISSSFTEYIVPIQIWRTETGEAFANGNSDFNHLWRHRWWGRIRIETTEAAEKYQARHTQAMRRAGVELECSTCNRRWPIKQCRDIKVDTEKPNFVFFTCPVCKVTRLAKVDTNQ